MRFRNNVLIRLSIFGLIGASLLDFRPVYAAENHRVTPLVEAVKNCQLSVVNLRGRKTVRTEATNDHQSGELKQVNGMGTGVVIDPRGYVLTNYHVVQGVREIEVTTGDHQRTTAQLLAHDPETDLAILKVDLDRPLPTIRIGTSDDLMLAETVTAVGNAYGYEHTVTMGIVSQLGRTVQVNDDQVYRNLIQTDAAINPGNSGGPLLNMNGEMIGINVAVRIGAQGIAFAIPVNDALAVAANLMDQIVAENVYHGLALKTVYVKNSPQLVITAVEKSSPAARAGLSKGQRIIGVDGKSVERVLDLNTRLVDATASQTLDLEVREGSTVKHVALNLEPRKFGGNRLAWKPLGLKVRSISESEMIGRHPNYKRGLKVLAVRDDSPAEAEGIMAGDVLVAMHGWKTESVENLAYILERKDVSDQKNFMFYILRDNEPFWGQIRVAQRLTD